MTAPDAPSGATRSFVLEQPAARVWDTLTDPDAGMWLLPKAVYSIASPDAANAGGAAIDELRGVWVDRVKKGVRRSTVWELIRTDPGLHATYRNRTEPHLHEKLDVRLRTEPSGTSVEMSYAQARGWWDLARPSSDRYLEGLEERLRQALSGQAPVAVNGQILTLTPGTGAKKQTHSIVIPTTPKLIWKIVNDKDLTLVPAPNRLTGWRRTVDRVEFEFAFNREANGAVVCTTARRFSDGPFRLTTIDAVGVEVLHELLPQDGDCLLRTTTRWTALLKSRDIRADADRWLRQIKEIAVRDPEAG